MEISLNVDMKWHFRLILSGNFLKVFLEHITILLSLMNFLVTFTMFPIFPNSYISTMLMNPQIWLTNEYNSVKWCRRLFVMKLTHVVAMVSMGFLVAGHSVTTCNFWTAQGTCIKLFQLKTKAMQNKNSWLNLCSEWHSYWNTT